MKSFRTEIENPEVEKDIIELEKKIYQFNNKKIDEEKFRGLRLARGIYGQRQPGVQMIRIKLPYGKLTADQMIRIADVCDEYSNGNLHTTTRQDIQIHYVSLDKTPELWAKLEKDDISLREACGNTVRNITASAIAGIDPNELFDVTPYAQGFFEYFLRNPICQDLGRKFKISFSSSDDDSAFTFMHDIGFIPRLKKVGTEEVRGFKVLIGGGLGSRPLVAKVAHHFLPDSEILPFTESVLKVFDRYGERKRRNRARLKFLLEDIGLDVLLRLAKVERPSSASEIFPFETVEKVFQTPEKRSIGEVTVTNKSKYKDWVTTNTFEQKQKGFMGIKIRLLIGNIDTMRFRKLAKLVKLYAGNDLRVTINQGLFIRFVPKKYLPYFFNQLDELGLAEPGFDSVSDITTCPGTDTCNLGISSSTGMTRELEQILMEEYPELIHNTALKIKISGCMNSCGHHSTASIGLHGSTLRVKNKVVPAMLVHLGGGPLGAGQGSMAEKLTKIPSKRIPDALRVLLDDYQENGQNGEYFNAYYLRQGKLYFLNLLQPFAVTGNLMPTDFIDWGHSDNFKTAIGIGECAGVTIDLVATLFLEVEEKLDNALSSLQDEAYADSIYFSYAAFISASKAMLISGGIETNTHAGIISLFDETYVDTNIVYIDGQFSSMVLKMKNTEPTGKFAEEYLAEAMGFHQQLQKARENQLINEKG